MFNLAQIEDTIDISPKTFDIDRSVTLKDALNRKCGVIVPLDIKISADEITADMQTSSSRASASGWPCTTS